MQQTWVWSLGREDPLEKEMATHSSTLPWRIPRTEEPGGLQSMGSQRVRHNWGDWAHKHSTNRLYKQSCNIQTCCTLFPILNQSIVSCLVLAVASWSAYRFLNRNVRWSGILISKNFSRFAVIHGQQPSCSQWSRSRFFGIHLFFSMTQLTLAIWSLVPFLNPACTTGSSLVTYSWNLAWRFLSITLIACEMTTIVWYFEHSLALPFLWNCKQNLTFSSPVTITEFSKFAGILNAAL